MTLTINSQLIEAVTNGNWYTVNHLISIGADVNHIDCYGCTPFYYLIDKLYDNLHDNLYGCGKCFIELLNGGLDINTYNMDCSMLPFIIMMKSNSILDKIVTKYNIENLQRDLTYFTNYCNIPLGEHHDNIKYLYTVLYPLLTCVQSKQSLFKLLVDSYVNKFP